MIDRYLNITDDVKIRRLVWVGLIIRMEDERTPKNVLKWKLRNTRPVGKPRTRQNKTGGRCPEGHITNPTNKMMEMNKGQEEWRHLLREAGAQKGLQYHT